MLDLCEAGRRLVSSLKGGDVGAFTNVNRMDPVERKIMKEREGVVDNMRPLGKEEAMETKVLLEEFM